jgi:hypothetical protein
VKGTIMISRRTFVGQTAGLTLALATGRRAWAVPVAPESITVFKSRTCACCAAWVDYLKAQGFAPIVHDEEDMDTVKDNLGVPKEVRSCHTAQVGKYLVEGHVPAEDIRRLLKEKPAVAGLAAPGMPASAPGMAQPGQPHQAYQVLAFKGDGSVEVFAKH